MTDRDLLIEIGRLRADNERLQKNMRDQFAALCAMRNDLNELLPIQHLEADLRDGPETSVFCAAVVEAARTALAAKTSTPPDTPAVPEPVAYTDATELEAVKNGNGLIWPSPISAHWEPYEETALYTEAQMQALADRLAECEKEQDEAIMRSSWHSQQRRENYEWAVDAEAALAEARKVIEPFAKRAGILDGLWKDHETDWSPEYGSTGITIGNLKAARQWLAANPAKEGQ